MPLMMKTVEISRSEIYRSRNLDIDEKNNNPDSHLHHKLHQLINENHLVTLNGITSTEYPATLEYHRVPINYTKPSSIG